MSAEDEHLFRGKRRDETYGAFILRKYGAAAYLHYNLLWSSEFPKAYKPSYGSPRRSTRKHSAEQYRRAAVSAIRDAQQPELAEKFLAASRRAWEAFSKGWKGAEPPQQEGPKE